MKKLVKISAFFDITILYCLILSFYSGNAVNYYADFSNHSGTEFCTPVDSSNLFCNTEQSEGSIDFCNKIPRTTLKNNFIQISSCSVTSELLLFSSFSQYIFYSKNLFIQFTSIVIIFPFHYFW